MASRSSGNRRRRGFATSCVTTTSDTFDSSFFALASLFLLLVWCLDRVSYSVAERELSGQQQQGDQREQESRRELVRDDRFFAGRVDALEDHSQSPGDSAQNPSEEAQLTGHKFLRHQHYYGDKYQASQKA